MHTKHSMAFIYFVFVLSVPNCAARAPKLLTYNDLLKQADLIVLATASETAPHKPDNANSPYDSVVTTFEVQGTLKGPECQSVQVVHLQQSERSKEIINGARTVDFVTEGRKWPYSASLPSARPVYLLHLKCRPDGRYEAVTGLYDMQDSVKVLTDSASALTESPK